MKDSDVTVTDLFCGAGGSSTGAVRAGARIRMALNHWPLAIKTHNENHPNTDHECTDISACDPRRYPSTTILISSPECTNHSLAKGVKRQQRQMSLLDNGKPDPAAERSRGTMWDTVRFTELHQYELVIVENVPDAKHWILYDAWLGAMHKLGYLHREVFLNSMFCWPTPQSRDRMYIVFWRKSNRAPRLDYTPLAYCTPCETNVQAVQVWKNQQKRFGKYKQQYIYCCPTCGNTVVPYYYCAANAIDWSLAAPRIGDRKRPLKEKTLARIRYGLEKYAGQRILTSVNYFRPNVPVSEPHPTQTSIGQHALVVPPFLLQTSQVSRGNNVRAVDSPFPTQTTCQDVGVCVPPALVVGLGYTHEQHNRRSYGVDAPLPTQTARPDVGLCVPPFIAELRHNSTARGIDEPLATMCASGTHHGLVTPPGAFVTSYYAQDKGHSIEDPLGTVSTHDRHGVVVPPFILGYYSRDDAVSAVSAALGTVVTEPRHALVQPTSPPNVDDCGFRMLVPREIGAAMAFPTDYVVHGNSRDQIKQYGNAVTPPAMEWLVGQCLASLN